MQIRHLVRVVGRERRQLRGERLGVAARLRVIEPVSGLDGFDVRGNGGDGTPAERTRRNGDAGESGEHSAAPHIEPLCAHESDRSRRDGGDRGGEQRDREREQVSRHAGALRVRGGRRADVGVGPC